MNNQFHELTKSLTQSVMWRAALKKFGVGLAGMVLACFSLANTAEAGEDGIPKWCDRLTNVCCCKKGKAWLPTREMAYGWCSGACGAIIGP